LKTRVKDLGSCEETANFDYKFVTAMSKSHDQKKEQKKKPQKTVKEKRAEKQAKKANRS
jgi:hypothetical protein